MKQNNKKKIEWRDKTLFFFLEDTVAIKGMKEGEKRTLSKEFISRIRHENFTTGRHIIKRSYFDMFRYCVTVTSSTLSGVAKSKDSKIER